MAFYGITNLVHYLELEQPLVAIFSFQFKPFVNTSFGNNNILWIISCFLHKANFQIRLYLESLDSQQIKPIWYVLNYIAWASLYATVLIKQYSTGRRWRRCVWCYLKEGAQHVGRCLLPNFRQYTAGQGPSSIYPHSNHKTDHPSVCWIALTKYLGISIGGEGYKLMLVCFKGGVLIYRFTH